MQPAAELLKVEVHTLLKGRYVIMSGRPCQVTEIQKILKYSKEAKKSLAYRYIKARDILTAEEYQEVYHSTFSVESFETSFRQARLLEVLDNNQVVVQSQG